MKIFIFILSVILFSKVTYAEDKFTAASWTLGAHRETQISIREKIINSNKVYVLASSRM